MLVFCVKALEFVDGQFCVKCPRIFVDSACKVTVILPFVLTSMMSFLLSLALAACSAIPPLFDMVPLGEMETLSPLHHGCPFEGGPRNKQWFKYPQSVSSLWLNNMTQWHGSPRGTTRSPTSRGSKTSPAAPLATAPPLNFTAGFTLPCLASSPTQFQFQFHLQQSHMTGLPTSSPALDLDALARAHAYPLPMHTGVAIAHVQRVTSRLPAPLATPAPCTHTSARGLAIFACASAHAKPTHTEHAHDVTRDRERRSSILQGACQ